MFESCRKGTHGGVDILFLFSSVQLRIMCADMVEQMWELSGIEQSFTKFSLPSRTRYLRRRLGHYGIRRAGFTLHVVWWDVSQCLSSLHPPRPYKWHRECLFGSVPMIHPLPTLLRSNTSALSGWGMRGLARLARKTFQFSLILAVKSRFLPLLWWHPVCTSWQLWATRHPIVGSMAFYELLKMLWEPGFLSYAPGSESAHMFHLSHFHRLVRFCWFGLVVGAVCLFCFCFLVVYWPTCSIELSTDDYFSISSWLPLSLWRAQHSPKKKPTLLRSKGISLNTFHLSFSGPEPFPDPPLHFVLSSFPFPFVRFFFPLWLCVSLCMFCWVLLNLHVVWWHFRFAGWWAYCPGSTQAAFRKKKDEIS